MVNVGTYEADIPAWGALVQPHKAILSPIAPPGILNYPPGASIGEALHPHHLHAVVEDVVASALAKHSAGVELPVEVDSI